MMRMEAGIGRHAGHVLWQLRLALAVIPVAAGHAAFV